MARHLLGLKENASSKYFNFVMLLSLRSGKDTMFIEHKIQQYANGEV